MMGRNHVALSVGTALMLAIPWLPGSLSTVAMVLGGIWIGAYLPDMDTDAMRVVHNAVTPRFLVRFGRWLLFGIVGFFFRLCRVPFRPEHRGSLHTVLGIAFYTIVITFAAYAGLTLLGYWDPLYLWLFAGLALGGLLHLLEDACTRLGVRPFIPLWGHRFHGGIVTGSGDNRPEVFASILFVMAGALYYLSVSRQLAFPKAMEITALTAATIWVLFFVWSKIPARGVRS